MKNKKQMREIKMAESLDTVHTHTHTQYLYRIGGQHGELYFNKIMVKIGVKAFINDAKDRLNI